MSIFIEYTCRKCGETYLPDTPGEPHGVELTGQECGGVGDFSNIRWLTAEAGGHDVDEVDQVFRDHSKYQKALENHELEMPDCSDPDCEFHHPEMREF